MTNPPENKRIVKLGDEEISLDSKNLEFNDTTISEFMDRVGLWYDYYVQKLAESEAMFAGAELKYELEYSKQYDHYKDEEGKTDKLADAKAKLHPDVITAKKEEISAKFKVNQLKQHLKAWDKAHDSAQNRGHTIRKEMDKLNSDIYYKNSDLDKEIEEIMKSR